MFQNNLESHFHSYCDSMSKDLLPNLGPYAKSLPTQQPDKYKTLADYLETLKVDIYSAIEDTSVDAYFTAITNHRFAIIQLLSKMVAVELEEHNDYLKLIEDNGWEAFRFSNCRGMTITFKDDFPAKRIIVVPYYADFCKESWHGNSFTFDVDELMLIKDLSWEEQKQIMNTKTKPHTKLIEGKVTALGEVNSVHTVRDWKLWGWSP